MLHNKKRERNCGWLWFETGEYFTEREAISLDARNEMLKSKLLSYLKDNNLRNSSRNKYDTINDFEALRRD